MHILMIIGIILLFALLIGSLFEMYWWVTGLLALLMFDTAFNKYRDNKLTDEQWRLKHPDKTERKISFVSTALFSLVGIIFCLISYSSFNLQTEKAHRDIERVSQLNEKEQKIFDERFQEYMKKESPDETSSRRKAWEDVDKILRTDAEAERKAAEEQKAREEEERRLAEEEKARLAAEQKAREEEERRLAEEEKARLAAEQKAREEEERRLAEEQKTREAESVKTSEMASLSDSLSDKEYLENIQPFAVADYLKNDSGIRGPLANGSTENLNNYAFRMQSLAQMVNDNNNNTSRAVAIYFKCEGELAAAYSRLNRDDKGIFETGISSINVITLTLNRNKAEEKIKKIAEECGADLSDYYEEELIKWVKSFINL